MHFYILYSFISGYLDDDEKTLAMELVIFPKNEPIPEDFFSFSALLTLGMAHFIIIYL
jgi:hypothetical protein